MDTILAIAKLLNISEVEAQDYCLKVQKCFVLAPSYKIIEDCLKLHPGENLSPEEVANLIPHSNPLVDTSQFTSPVTRRNISPGICESMLPMYAERERFAGHSIDNLDPREYIERFEKCRHGVPKHITCAICEPERFKFETGIDE